MSDFWEEELSRGHKQKVDVAIINDLPKEWQGDLILYMRQGEKRIVEQTQNCILPPLGRKVISFPIEFPVQTGIYDLIAEIEVNGEPVRSTRRFKVQ
jgi:hypothetical protein